MRNDEPRPLKAGHREQAMTAVPRRLRYFASTQYQTPLIYRDDVIEQGQSRIPETISGGDILLLQYPSVPDR